MHYFYRNAALLGLAYLEAKIKMDLGMINHIRSITNEQELNISINQAVLHITRTLSGQENYNIEEPLNVIHKTRQLLIKQIINV